MSWANVQSWRCRSALMAAVAATLPAALSVGCVSGGASLTESAAARPISDDISFLRSHDSGLRVLAAPGGGSVVVSPKFQGRVMTSAVGPTATAADPISLGWVNRAFIAAEQTGTAFDNYGGEDRFWLAPEAGPFALFLRPDGPRDAAGTPFTLAGWQVPTALQLGTWLIEDRVPGEITFVRYLTVSNFTNKTFTLRLDRRIRTLSAGEIASRFSFPVPGTVRYVAFESFNRITNVGSAAITMDQGPPAIWVLGQFPAFAGSRAILPIAASTEGPAVTDDYRGPFAKVPSDRLTVRLDADGSGYALLRSDGSFRAKVGVPPHRAAPILGSLCDAGPFAERPLLTLVAFNKPRTRANFVNNRWSMDASLYNGDPVSVYNDVGSAAGPTFYELETLSPALELPPGASREHIHTTVHLIGEPSDLSRITQVVFGVELSALK